MPARISYPLLIHHQWTQIRFRKVAVVVASFLRSARANRFACSIPEQRLLLDLATGIQQGALPLVFCLQCPLDRGEGVHVLDLGLGPELRLSRRTHADVRIHAKTSLLHADIAYVQILEDLLQGPEISASRGGGPDVGLAHDLDERNASPIEIDGCRARVTVVNRLARILFHVQARNAVLVVTSALFLTDGNGSPSRERLIELRYLVTLRQVGIEVVLA